MAKDHFLDWLREKILQNPQGPPSDTWQEISDSLDLEDSWSKIGDELEVNSIWSRIDSRLSRFYRLRKFENLSYGISAIAVLVLLLGIFSQETNSFLDPPSGQETVAGQNSPSDNKEEEKAIERGIRPKLKNDSLIGSLIQEEEGIENKKSTIEHEDETALFASILKDKNNLQPPISEAVSLAGSGAEEGELLRRGEEKIGAKPIWNFILPVQKRVPVFPGPDDELVKEMPAKLPVKVAEQEGSSFPTLYPGVYAGMGTNLKASWLLNQKTMQAMEKSSLLTAAPNFQHDIFLTSGIKLKPCLFLQLDGYLKNTVGQEYQEYRDGKFGEVEELLTYRSLALSFSWLKGQVGYGKMPTYSRWLAGIYGGRLYQAQEVSQAESTSRIEEYAKQHFGLLAGLEYDTFLNDHFIFTYGLRARTDLLNIYSGTGSLPLAFQKNRAFSLDFSISLKYILKE